MGDKRALYPGPERSVRLLAQRYSLPESTDCRMFVNRKLALEVQCSPYLKAFRRQKSKATVVRATKLLATGKTQLKERLTQLQGDFSILVKIWVSMLRHKFPKTSFETQISSASRTYGPTDFISGQGISLWKGNLLEILRFPYQRNKTTRFAVVQRFHYLSLHSPTVVLLSLPYWIEEAGGSYIIGDNLLNHQLDG